MESVVNLSTKYMAVEQVKNCSQIHSIKDSNQDLLVTKSMWD